jgi:hypothetical protein
VPVNTGRLGSGVYFVKLVTLGGTQVKTMIISVQN